MKTSIFAVDMCVYEKTREKQKDSNKWVKHKPTGALLRAVMNNVAAKIWSSLSLSHTHNTHISKSSKCANITDQSSVCRHFREILLGFCSPTQILDWYVLDREDERPCHEQETQEAVNPQCSGLGKLLAGTQK